MIYRVRPVLAVAGTLLTSMSVRVRFAPSPTGLLHIGALRTVLYDDLLARKHEGQNILRIEDTDRDRCKPEFEDEFIETLRWVGIEFDEGPHVGGPHAPYRQSERKEAGIYEPYFKLLLERGRAYKAFDTPEELSAMRAAQEAKKESTGYDGGEWRDASPDKVAEAEAEGKPFVVRLRIPRDTTIVLNDAVRGRVEWDSNLVDDPVLIKADGMPTYHFAAMVDDHLMGITHVLRGEEWIPSAPKHVVLFEAFGWEMPAIVHCPVIVGTDGKKLSKRHGATRVLDYAAQGFLPHPLKNFIALIGWSPGEDREILTETELVELFDLSRLHVSPGKFDLEKLVWLNGVYIRSLAPGTLLGLLNDYMALAHTRDYHYAEVDDAEGGALEQAARIRRFEAVRAITSHEDREYVLSILPLVQERVSTLADFGDACAFFFTDEPEMDPKAVSKWFGEPHVRELLSALAEYEGPATVEGYEALLRGFQEEHGMEKLGPVVHPTRVALTGKTTGPGLFELMAVLGPARIRSRALRALSTLS